MVTSKIIADPIQRVRIACAYSLACLALTVLGAQAASAAEVVFWQDPVVTHTNGARLASSTSLRSHNMYWQCDPGHRGYCNGHVYSPCRDDLVGIGSRRGTGYQLPYGPYPQAVSNQSYQHGYNDGFEAIEMVDSERLGSIPNSLLINGAGSSVPLVRQ